MGPTEPSSNHAGTPAPLTTDAAPSAPASIRDITLTEEERRVAQALKREYGFKYPFAAHIAKSAIAAMEPDGRLEAARQFIENVFAPWGSWKTAWWEGAVGDDHEMTDANALRYLRQLLGAP